ncbi:Arylsulfotransferase, partial [Macrophomina phaseolina MS6]
QLVWSGYQPDMADIGNFNLKRHELANGSHILSLVRGKSERGRGQGHVLLLDDAYRPIRTIRAETPGTALDFHEFNLLDGGAKAIIASFQPVQGDLSAYDITQGLGWVLDSVFQEIDLKSGEVLFEWRAWDHVPLSETSISPDGDAGGGRSSFVAFDYFHINSVDKFPNGDYLVSARHTDCVYRISGKDGSVLWRMGGRNSTIQLADFDFSAQHDARILSEEGNKLRMSFFNNGWNGISQTRNASAAMVVEIDHTTSPSIARLLHERFSLQGGLARHQGTVQTLPNGNMFVSWGQVAEFSEFTSDGERILDAAFVDVEAHVYRVAKVPWQGFPDTMPDLYLYARAAGEPTHFYVSWNGATEVAAWNIYSADEQGKGEKAGSLLGKVAKNGFETHFESPKFVSAGFAEAVDKDGQVLAHSKVQQVLVPPASMTRVCGPAHCTIQQILPTPDGDLVRQDFGRVQPLSEGTIGFPLALIQAFVVAVAGFLVGSFSQTSGIRRLLR